MIPDFTLSLMAAIVKQLDEKHALGEVGMLGWEPHMPHQHFTEKIWAFVALCPHTQKSFLSLLLFAKAPFHQLCAVFTLRQSIRSDLKASLVWLKTM